MREKTKTEVKKKKKNVWSLQGRQRFIFLYAPAIYCDDDDDDGDDPWRLLCRVAVSLDLWFPYTLFYYIFYFLFFLFHIALIKRLSHVLIFHLTSLDDIESYSGIISVVII